MLLVYANNNLIGKTNLLSYFANSSLGYWFNLVMNIRKRRYFSISGAHEHFITCL